MIRSAKLRKSAQGEDCTMGSPHCNGNPETVVWCHSNHQEHGKGRGLKAHDIFGFYGCSACHYWYDVVSQSWDRDDRLLYFYRANAKSLVRLFEKGILRL